MDAVVAQATQSQQPAATARTDFGGGFIVGGDAFGQAKASPPASPPEEQPDWGAEELTRGCYSYPRAGGGDSRAHRAALCAAGAAGEGVRVCFAGEHAHVEHCMTVHAAMESGARAGGAAARLARRPAPRL